ncbi:protein SEMI-ROLLED LEAF 2-like isoform X2 [Silene latifolia]|uniref:protein SEMI-ROLLED LEAF 2-like isoform X2 n=1 Tax=Silene latifolia TaxID=37657 RepID=UPI003D784AD6
MPDAEENSHLLISILVKHLDQRNVVKQPLKQINIIHVITRLTQFAKQHASVALTGLLRHSRKCMQFSKSGADKLNEDLQSALENCIWHLSSKFEVARRLDNLWMKLDKVDEMTSSTITADPQIKSILSSTLDIWMLVITATPGT